MHKYLFTLTSILLVATTTITAQQKTVFAFNAEQIIEKIGFENMVTAFVSTKKSYRSDEAAVKTAEATRRKAFAALYGSGIDFTKKMWYQSNKSIVGMYTARTGAMPIVNFVVPIGNREVLMSNMLNILNSKKVEDEKATTYSKNGVNDYCIKGNTLYIFTQKDLIIAPIFQNFEIYDYNMYEGKTVKVDTIKVTSPLNRELMPPTPIYNAEQDSKKTLQKKVPQIEIDKLVNGKVVRLYKSVPEKVKATKKIVKGYESDDIQIGASRIIVDKGVESPTLYTNDTANSVAVKNAATKAAMDVMRAAKEAQNEVMTITSDTLTRIEYVDENTNLKIYYIPYTEQEKTDIVDKKALEKEAKTRKYVDSLLQNTDVYLPYLIANKDINTIADSKADMAMLMDNTISGINPFFKKMMHEVDDNNTEKKQVTSTSFINFENGKMVMLAQEGCCNKANDYINKLYLPITDFWATELNKSNIGIGRANVSLPILNDYYNNYLGFAKKMHLVSSEIGFEFKDVEDAFTGEIAMTMSMEKNAESRTGKPAATIAFKIKNISKAISLLNKIGSNKVENIKQYKFDVDGQYLLLNTEKLPTPAVASNNVRPQPALPMGNFGTFNMDLKSLIKGFLPIDESKAKSQDEVLNFFGTVSFINNKTEDGKFEGSMEMDMGNKSTNALANLFTLINKMGEAKDSERKPMQFRMPKDEVEVKPKASTKVSRPVKTTKKKK